MWFGLVSISSPPEGQWPLTVASDSSPLCLLPSAISRVYDSSGGQKNQSRTASLIPHAGLMSHFTEGSPVTPPPMEPGSSVTGPGDSSGVSRAMGTWESTDKTCTLSSKGHLQGQVCGLKGLLKKLANCLHLGPGANPRQCADCPPTQPQNH